MGRNKTISPILGSVRPFYGMPRPAMWFNLVCIDLDLLQIDTVQSSLDPSDLLVQPVNACECSCNALNSHPGAACSTSSRRSRISARPAWCPALKLMPYSYSTPCNGLICIVRILLAALSCSAPRRDAFIPSLRTVQAPSRYRQRFVAARSLRQRTQATVPRPRGRRLRCPFTRRAARSGLTVSGQTEAEYCQCGLALLGDGL